MTYNPTMRLLAVLELLQSRREVSAAELAKTLEVDERSVRRYIMMLRDMSIPIDGERGPGGGYALRPGFRLPPLMFNPDEITAVMMSLRLTHDSGAMALPAVETAIAKIERVLPAELAQYAGALRQAVTISGPQFTSYPIDGEQLLAFTQAVYQGRCLTITYQAADGTLSERQIAPYGLVLHAHTWYIPAYCYLREDIRIFRADRVRAFALTAVNFTLPADFDPTVYVLNSLATLPGTYTFEVLIHTPLSTVEAVLPPSLAVLEPAGHETLMRCYSDDGHWLARYLLRLELPFTVIGPDELREAFRAVVDEIEKAVKSKKVRAVKESDESGKRAKK